jgi:hypothetical protein
MEYWRQQIEKIVAQKRAPQELTERVPLEALRALMHSVESD